MGHVRHRENLLVALGRRSYSIPLMAADTVGLLDVLSIAGAQLVKFEGCGHAFITEAEEQAACCILDFLAGNEVEMNSKK